MIILDYLIGDEAYGWQLLQKLKMDRDTEHIPVIVCSAAVKQLRELEGWLTEKGVGVVFKPFNIDDLVFAVHKVLDGTIATLAVEEDTKTRASPSPRRSAPPPKSNSPLAPRRKQRHAYPPDGHQ